MVYLNLDAATQVQKLYPNDANMICQSFRRDKRYQFLQCMWIRAYFRIQKPLTDKWPGVKCARRMENREKYQ